MITLYSIYMPGDGYSICASRQEAFAEARAALDRIDGADGWPDDIECLGVYNAPVDGFSTIDEANDALFGDEPDWRPVWTLREKPGSRREVNPCSAGTPEGDEYNHEDCKTCEGSGLVDEHGEPIPHHAADFAYMVEYEFPPEEEAADVATQF